MRHRLALWAVAGTAAGMVTACAGHTTPASEVTNSSAKINAVGTCQQQCVYHFRYRRLYEPGTSSAWSDLPDRGPVGSVPNETAFGEAVSGMQANTRYEYQVCGKETSQSGSQTCVGPDSQTGTTQVFATGPSWADSFESSALGGFSGWWWWGQGQSSVWGHVSVVDPTTEGVPRLDGTKVARFEVTADDAANGRIHAKIYKGFWDATGEKAPANVSGTYSAWYYLPTSYRLVDQSATNPTTVLPFGFKEDWTDESGHHQDGTWWLQLNSVKWSTGQAIASGTPPPSGSDWQPAVHVARDGRAGPMPPRHYVTVPLGRWFHIKAVVTQGVSIQFYVDGTLLDQVKQSEFPVGPTHRESPGAWIFEVGDYASGGVAGTHPEGPVYVDKAKFTAP